MEDSRGWPIDYGKPLCGGPVVSGGDDEGCQSCDYRGTWAPHNKVEMNGVSKFCRDCKWARRRWYSWPSYDLARCANPVAIARVGVSLVEGPSKDSRPFCDNERRFGNCGKQGTLWEPKE